MTVPITEQSINTFFLCTNTGLVYKIATKFSLTFFLQYGVQILAINNDAEIFSTVSIDC